MESTEDVGVYVFTVDLQVKVLAGDVPWKDVADELCQRIKALRTLKVVRVAVDRGGDDVE